jgi:phosphate/sulfate permease
VTVLEVRWRDIFAFIIIVSSILVTIALATYFSIGSFLGTFNIIISPIIGPLVGAFFGVLFGFWINRRHGKKLEENRRLFFKSLIMHEIEESIKILELVESDQYEKVRLIPEDAWNSIVNSGDISLLEETNAIELGDIYFKIKKYNQKAKNINNAALELMMYPMQVTNDIPSNLKALLDRDTIPMILERLRKIESWLK